jgi:hypothetical protein
MTRKVSTRWRLELRSHLAGPATDDAFGDRVWIRHELRSASLVTRHKLREKTTR